MAKKTRETKKEFNIADTGIRVYGVRKVQEIGISAYCDDVQKNGISIITINKKPSCMVLPMSYLGLKKSFEQIRMLYDNIEQDAAVESAKMLLDDTYELIEQIKE